MSKKTTDQLAVLVPTYNEIANIGSLIQTIFSVVPQAYIFIIDDNSPDGTAELVESLAKKNSRLFLLRGEKKAGIGKAYARGFKAALKYPVDFIAQMDADFSHNPKDLLGLVKKLKEEEYDLVIGSRYVQGVNVINWPMQRVILSYFASVYINFITKLGINDCTSGFKCFRRKVAAALPFNKIRSNGYIFQVETNYIVKKMGFKIGELSIVFTDRKLGFSKISKKIIWEALYRVLLLPFKRVPKPAIKQQ